MQKEHSTISSRPKLQNFTLLKHLNYLVIGGSVLTISIEAPSFGASYSLSKQFLQNGHCFCTVLIDTRRISLITADQRRKPIPFGTTGTSRICNERLSWSAALPTICRIRSSARLRSITVTNILSAGVCHLGLIYYNYFFIV